MTNAKALNYKQLVTQIAGIKTTDEAGAIGGQINRSFEAEKITANDFETLWELLNRLYNFIEKHEKAAEQ